MRNDPALRLLIFGYGFIGGYALVNVVATLIGDLT